MESINHLKISALASPAAVYLLFGFQNPVHFIAVSLIGVAAGVLIDLDHFIWARINHGHWNHLLETLKQPLTVIKDNQEVMSGALESNERYVSHLLLLVIAGSFTLTVVPLLGAVVVALMSIHISCDLYASWREGLK